MLGKLLSKTVKAVTFPIDVVERTGDWLCGGDGTKEEQIQNRKLGANGMSQLRDIVTDTLEELDD